VRREHKCGGDWIKTTNSGGYFSPGDDPRRVTWFDDEMATVCETAAQLGMPVAVHTGAADCCKQAIRCGVRSLDAEGNKLLGSGEELNEVCRHLEIAESTWHRWLAQYGGMKANEAKRLKELEAENARLKKLVANQALDIDMLKEISADAPIDVKC
jgi:putative transposase